MNKHVVHLGIFEELEEEGGGPLLQEALHFQLEAQQGQHDLADRPVVRGAHPLQLHLLPGEVWLKGQLPCL